MVARKLCSFRVCLIGFAVRADFRRLYPANAKTPTCCPSDDNRTKVTNSVTSARSLWWHVGPYFWPTDLTRTANPIGSSEIRQRRFHELTTSTSVWLLVKLPTVRRCPLQPSVLVLLPGPLPLRPLVTWIQKSIERDAVSLHWWQQDGAVLLPGDKRHEVRHETQNPPLSVCEYDNQQYSGSHACWKERDFPYSSFDGNLQSALGL